MKKNNFYQTLQNRLLLGTALIMGILLLPVSIVQAGLPPRELGEKEQQEDLAIKNKRLEQEIATTRVKLKKCRADLNPDSDMNVIVSMQREHKRDLDRLVAESEQKDMFGLTSITGVNRMIAAQLHRLDEELQGARVSLQMIKDAIARAPKEKKAIVQEQEAQQMAQLGELQQYKLQQQPAPRVLPRAANLYDLQHDNNQLKQTNSDIHNMLSTCEGKKLALNRQRQQNTNDIAQQEKKLLAKWPQLRGSLTDLQRAYDTLQNIRIQSNKLSIELKQIAEEMESISTY